jgi:NADH-quinone oxidoreductase subunit H
VLADINAGLLYIMALTSMGVYGVIIAGWASNSKYAFLGAMRSAAQMVSYELAMGFALVVVLMVSGSLNLSDIVERRAGAASPTWASLSCPGTGCRCCRCCWSTSSRHRRDQPRALRRGRGRVRDRRRPHGRVLGHDLRAVLPSRYMNMLLISALTVVMFFGGWQPPIACGAVRRDPGILWFVLKIFLVVSMFLWIRATLPRYRYDQIMRLGWKCSSRSRWSGSR